MAPISSRRAFQIGLAVFFVSIAAGLVAAPIFALAAGLALLSGGASPAITFSVLQASVAPGFLGVTSVTVWLNAKRMKLGTLPYFASGYALPIPAFLIATVAQLDGAFETLRDVGLYCAAVMCTAYITFKLHRVVRGEPQFLPGPHCPACGYSLLGNETGTCPECGARSGRLH